ncbi:ABC transporter substrate-binding protein [Salipaludibacillus keqinensis]|uniref:ABC transporter substrate-binding protein n=1 Tax=Salipaludibacillus keqinensis TaxID=2045207 RepID=A0A323TB65_9BACI|nr:sugar ABC transporter substrate-binding protein [Salipaludibacillus keqinensis]PYZ92692.1 ABC transporter substrate-binding protein [Salipaludibacillus keqinensis]
MTKKFYLSIALMVSSALMITACGGGGSEDETELSVWAMGEEGTLLPELAEKFEEENPEISINVQAIPWDTAHDNLLTAVASGEGPDVLQMGTSWVPEFADVNMMLDLTPYLDDYPAFNKENYFDGAAESMEYEDQIVGIPWYVDTRVLYYRTDLLAEVGYDDAPATWDELKDASTQLADRGDDYYGYDIDQNDQFVPFMFAWQNGSDFIDEEGNTDFESPEFMEAMEFYHSFFAEGITPTSGQLDIIQSFSNGQQPMFQSGPWMVNILNNDAPDIEGDWAVAPLPEKETNTSYIGGSNLSVFNNTDHVEESLQFIDFLVDEETQLEWFEISNTLPSRVDAWDDSRLDGNEMLSVFGEQLEETRASPQLPEWEAIAQEMIRSMERVNVGGADLQEEMEDFREKVEEDILAD